MTSPVKNLAGLVMAAETCAFFQVEGTLRSDRCDRTRDWLDDGYGIGCAEGTLG